MLGSETGTEKAIKTSLDLQKQLEYEAAQLKYDTQAKRLFGFKEVMGYILKFMIPEFESISAEEAAKYILEVQISENEVSENYGDGSFAIKKQQTKNNATTGRFQKLPSESRVINEKTIYPMCRKTPCFSYGDIRHFHRIYASN